MTNDTIITQNGAKILLNRFGKASPDYTIISNFEVSIDTADCAWTDTALTTLIPITGTETITDCSTATGWTASTGSSVSVNTTTFKPDGGTDGALNFTKSTTTTTDITVSKATSSVNGTSKDLIMWLYIKDGTIYNKLSATTAALIRLGSDNSNYYEKVYATTALTAGWNFLKVAIPSGFTSTQGTPAIAALDYTYIATSSNTATATWSDGDFIFDAIRAASADDYYKAVDSVTLDETDASIAYVSKLSVTDANGFLINGLGLLNTDSPALLGIKSKFPNNSKDTTDLFKFTTKLKIRNQNQVI